MLMLWSMICWATGLSIFAIFCLCSISTHCHCHGSTSPKILTEHPLWSITARGGARTFPMGG